MLYYDQFRVRYFCKILMLLEYKLIKHLYNKIGSNCCSKSREIRQLILNH